MRIVDITMFWAPRSGGVRTYLNAKRRWLARQPDVEHILLVPGEAADCSAHTCTLPAFRVPGQAGYRFPLSPRRWVETLVHLKPDLIEAGDPYVPAWAALKAGRLLGIPVIGYYHSDLPRLVSTRAGVWSRRLLEAYVANLYGRFDAVLAPSNVMVQSLHRMGVERVSEQPLGVDVDLFHPGRCDVSVRHELGLCDNTRLMVFAGRCSREKNIPVLLETMQILGPKYHLHLVGTDIPQHLPTNVSSASGFLDQAQLARILASSDALLHAGNRETFGLVVLEAMACGTPVVGVHGGAVSELVAPGTGRLAACSPHALAREVRALCAEDYRAMGCTARRHVEAHYDWNRVLASLFHHYRDMSYSKDNWPRVVNA
jgi:alpha-1,6-mannosyltransferase